MPQLTPDTSALTNRSRSYVERLAIESQHALRDVVAILKAIESGADRMDIYYNIGKAQQTAINALRGDL